MIRLLCVLAVLLLATTASLIRADEPPPPGRAAALFDGRTLDGWEGDPAVWRVEDGAITGGSLAATVPRNEFLCTTRELENFVLRLQFKLSGTEGFVNGGVQVRSRRVSGSNEVAGYQCDLGDPDWWGAVYDEARRDRVLFPTDMVAVGPVLRRGDWNEYVIRADGPRLTVWLNGVQTADYYEDDPAIASRGVLGIQVHGGGKTLMQVKDISIEELPPTPPGARFAGAPAPGAPRKPSPLTAEEERAAFTLPPGFEIELVASELEGAAKPITVVWDAAGRLWTMTALEYPVDANDNKEVAAALYAEPRRDRVLVFDDPNGPGPHRPRVFAEGLAIPLGLLPYKDGAFVQHGSDILFLRDSDGDGRADQRETVLEGFGIGDSHLLPHQLTRAPGGWILVAQGAFNDSFVRTRAGETVEFHRTRLGRFTPDGMRFESLGWGPCNIWGLVLDGEGEVFIQEANDYGYPVMPFHAGGCYPGCTPFPKPYAPPYPGLSRLGMGGTGLSGLALSDAASGWPAPYTGVFYVANPVTQRVQAVKLFHDGPRWSLVKLPDFLRSSDEWFRPVAIHFGPDGCLYVVDWYNKVISHNEVPRDHPDRDRSRGRIWRVRREGQARRATVDFTRLAGAELLRHLGGDSLWRSHAAWQQIADRGAVDLAPRLEEIARDPGRPAAARIQALWALEGLSRASPALLRGLLGEASRNLRREAVRALAAAAIDASELLDALEPLAGDPDPDVRAEVIRSVAPRAGEGERALAFLVRMGREPLPGPLARGTHSGGPIKVREAYDREFERYLVRAALERHAAAVARFLAGEASRGLPVESRLLAALAIEPGASASLVARLLPALARPANEEELLRLAELPDQPGAGDALRAVLESPPARAAAVEALLRGRTRFDAARLEPIVAEAALSLLGGDEAARDLALRLTSGFKLKALEPRLASELERPGLPAPRQAAVLRALREVGSARPELFARLAADSPDAAVRGEALAALAAAPAADAAPRLFELWPALDPIQRRAALDRLASSRAGAAALVGAARRGALPERDLDAPLLEKALALLGDDPALESLLDELGSVARPVLRLDGKEGSYASSDIALEGPFTVETWIRLDPGIGNDDGILGRPGGADFNFHDGLLRVYGGPAHGDRIIARRKMTPELWTHVAVTRDGEGGFKIYLDGELDTAECRPLREPLTGLDIGRVSPARGTGAMLAEYRVWSRCRSAEEVRADFDRALEGPAEGLVLRFPGGGPWGKLSGTARVARTLDAPPLVTAEETRALTETLARFRALAERPGDAARGREVAAKVCQRCHAIRGEGAQIGPTLDGAGAKSLDALLRALLTPNAAMEGGYRVYRVELEADEVLDAFLVSQDQDAVILRMPDREDRRVPRREILRAGFIRRSLMAEGLLEALPEAEAVDLLSYLRTLK